MINKANGQDLRNEVAAEVRASIARANLSASYVAAEARISHSSMHRKLHGTRSFTIEELVRIAQVLEVSPSSIIAPVTQTIAA